MPLKPFFHKPNCPRTVGEYLGMREALEKYPDPDRTKAEHQAALAEIDRRIAQMRDEEKERL